MKALEQDGDVAMDSVSYEDAVAHYSIALGLDPLSAVLLTKRSNARAGTGSWEDALQDADAVRVSYVTPEQAINTIPGDQTQSIISVWPRKKTCSTTRRSPLC